MDIPKQNPIDEKVFKKLPINEQEELIVTIDEQIVGMQELSQKLKEITAKVTAKTLLISEKLLDKPHMTDEDKKNMSNALAYLKDVGAYSENNLARLQEIVYTPTTINFWNTKIARELPTGGDGIYDQETKKRYYTSPYKVPKPEWFYLLKDYTPIKRLSDNFKRWTNYPGSMLFALIMWLPQDWYMQEDGTNYGRGKYGVIWLRGKEYYEYEYEEKKAMIRYIYMDEEATLYLLAQY